MKRKEAQRKFLAYLTQRGRISLEQMAMAYGINATIRSSNGQIAYRNKAAVAALDEWCTEVLPEGGARIVGADGQVNFWREAPREYRSPSAPAIRVWVDPQYAGSWKPNAEQIQTDGRGGKRPFA